MYCIRTLDRELGVAIFPGCVLRAPRPGLGSQWFEALDQNPHASLNPSPSWDSLDESIRPSPYCPFFLIKTTDEDAVAPEFTETTPAFFALQCNSPSHRSRMGWTGLRRRTGFDPVALEKFSVAAANRLAPAWPRIRRFSTSRQAVVLLIALVIAWLVCLQLSLLSSEWTSSLSFISIPGFRKSPRRMTSAYNTLPPLAERIPCYGPRGHLLSESPDDELDEVELSQRTGAASPSQQSHWR